MKCVVAVILSVVASFSLAAVARAGHNAGAALIVHTTAFSKTTNCPGLRTAIEHCEEANPTSSAGEGQDFVLAVYATRPDSMDPVYGKGVTLNAVDFGIEYSNAVVASWHPCGDFEVSTSGGEFPTWPASGSGNTVTWTAPLASAQGEVVLIGYFNVYVYGAGTFEITAHPQVGVARLLDEVSQFDDVSLLGHAGFGGATGSNQCPDEGGDSLDRDDTSDDGDLSGGDDLSDGGDSSSSYGGALIIGREARLDQLIELDDMADYSVVTPHAYVTLEDLRISYPGLPDSLVILNKIQDYFAEANRLKSYVLLVGGWSRQFPQFQEIPTWYIDAGELGPVAPTDQPYGDLDSDGVWDISVWRVVPLNDEANHALCVKSRRYWDMMTDHLPPEDWMRQVAVHCEDGDYGQVNSPGLARNLTVEVHESVQSPFVADPVVYSSDLTPEEEVEVLPDALADGKVIIVAGPSTWSGGTSWLRFSPSIYQFSQAAPTARPPLMIGASCDLAHFTYYLDENDSRPPLCRDWMHVENDSIGPIAWIGPTRGSHQYINAWFTERLIQLLTSYGHTAGQALLVATRELFATHPEAAHAVQLYAGLGVPWFRLPRTYTTTGAPEDPPSVPPLLLAIAPNPVSSGAVVRIAVAVPGASSRATVRVYGPGGRLVREMPVPNRVETGIARLTWDTLDRAGRPVPSGAYFIQAEVAGRTYGAKVIVAR